MFSAPALNCAKMGSRSDIFLSHFLRIRQRLKVNPFHSWWRLMAGMGVTMKVLPGSHDESKLACIESWISGNQAGMSK